MSSLGWAVVGATAIALAVYGMYRLIRAADKQVAESVARALPEHPEPKLLHSSGPDEEEVHCFDCGAMAETFMPWAMAKDGTPIEAALCLKCADMETSTASSEDES